MKEESNFVKFLEEEELILIEDEAKKASKFIKKRMTKEASNCKFIKERTWEEVSKQFIERVG